MLGKQLRCQYLCVILELLEPLEQGVSAGAGTVRRVGMEGGIWAPGISGECASVPCKGQSWAEGRIRATGVRLGPSVGYGSPCAGLSMVMSKRDLCNVHSYAMVGGGRGSGVQQLYMGGGYRIWGWGDRAGSS